MSCLRGALGPAFWILLLPGAKALTLSTVGTAFFSSHLSAFIKMVVENLLFDLSSSSVGMILLLTTMGTFSYFFGVSMGDIKLNSLPDGVFGAVLSTSGTLWLESCVTICKSVKKLTDLGMKLP